VGGVQQTVTESAVLDADGRVLEAIDAVGAKTTISYGANGKPVRQADALSRQTTYEYDAQGRLVKTVYPDGTSETSAYDAEGNQVAHTDRANRTTRYEYDALNRLSKTFLPAGGVEETFYDAVGRVRLVKDAAGGETIKDYDDAGRLTSEKDPAGGITRYEYDGNGNRTKMTDPRGNITDYEYDALNRLIKTTFPPAVPDGPRPFTTIAWRTDNRKLSETDANGRVTSYTYDAVGRLRTVTQTVGGVAQVTTYGYDEVGNKTLQTDAETRQTRWEFDHAKRPTRRTLPLAQTESHVYDLAGNRIQTTDFLGRVLRFTYNADNRLVLKTLPDGTRVTYAYTPTGQLAEVTVSGNVAGNGLQNGTTRLRRDAADRLVRQDNPDGSFIAYAYDASGNRTEMSTASGTTRYQYDAASRLIAVVAPSGETTRYGYDAAGNRTVASYPNNTRTVYEYDSTNRVTQIAHLRLPDAANPAPRLLAGYRYTLNGAGQRTKVEDHGAETLVSVSGGAGTGEAGGSGPATLAASLAGTAIRTVEWRYDETDRLIEEKVTEAGAAAPRTTTYTYDKVGNRKTKTEAAVGLSVITTYSYDANDRLFQEVRSSGATSTTTLYAWDANGNLASKTEGSGYTGYSYDAENRLIEVRQGATQASAQVVASYVYDSSGNRIAKTVNGQTTRFLVDSSPLLAQILEETAPTGEKMLYIRGAGLIARSRQSASSYVYADHLGSTRLIADAEGGATLSVAYDAFGLLVAQAGSALGAFRFAGEYFDAETGFAYHRARYLDPASGRFITQDPLSGAMAKPIALNHYLYASANPVDNIDPTGLFSMGEAMTSMNTMMTLANTAITTFNDIMSMFGSGELKVDGIPTLWDFLMSFSVRALGTYIGLETVVNVAGLVTAEKTERHHVIPKYLCGKDDQMLSRLPQSDHKQIHRELNRFRLAIDIAGLALDVAFKQPTRKIPYTATQRVGAKAMGRAQIAFGLTVYYTQFGWVLRGFPPIAVALPIESARFIPYHHSAPACKG
jgi:RHS repeat-associated protein